MAGTIKHMRVVTKKESEKSGFVIGYPEWNDGHVIEIGSARIYVGLDAGKATVPEPVDGNVYMATDTQKLYCYYNNDWQGIITGIVSNPPNGGKKITNFWWDPVTEQLVVTAED